METRSANYRAMVQDIVDTAPFIQEVGIRVADVGPGWCEMELPLLPRHLQQNGYVHAGVLATLADHTAGSAATSLVAPNEYVLSAEFNMSLLRAAKGERLRCRAEVIKPGSRLIVTESSVYVVSGEQSTLVVKARITLAVLERREEP